MKVLRILVFLIAWVGARQLPAETTMTALTASAHTWVTLSVAGLPAGSAEIILQDARGGPAFGRKITPTDRAVILALPLISPSDLADGRWALEFTARDAAAKELAHTRISVTLPATNTFQIAETAGAEAQAAAHIWPAAQPLNAIPLPPEEFAAAPAQAFAGFDAIYIPSSLAGPIDENRVLALCAAGPQVVIAGETQPFGGLSKLLWRRLDNSAVPAWICTSQTSPPIPLITPDLAQISIENPSDALAPPIVHSILIIGPAAVFLALVIRALLRKPLAVLAASAGAFTLLAVATIIYLCANDLAMQTIARWHTLPAGESASTGSIESDTQLTLCSTRFGQTFQLSAPTLLPLAATPHAYWQLRNLEFTLDADSTALRAKLQPRQQLLLQQQHPSAAPFIPAFPQFASDRARFLETLHAAPNSSFWLIGGYVYPATADSLDLGSIIFPAWSRTQLQNRQSLDTWYALRFRADTRYFFQLEGDAPRIVEFRP
jgi:hypothetical protein